MSMWTRYYLRIPTHNQTFYSVVTTVLQSLSEYFAVDGKYLLSQQCARHPLAPLDYKVPMKLP